MSGRFIFLVIAVSFCLNSFSQVPPKVPNELNDFYKKLESRFKALEEGLVGSEKETSLASKFLMTTFHYFQKQEKEKGKELAILDTLPALKEKLLSLIKDEKEAKKEKPALTSEQLEKILNESASALTEKEKIELTGLLLVQLEKYALNEKDTSKALESLIQKYQKDPLLEETKKSDKKDIALLTDIITIGLSNPETLDTLFSPLKENIFAFEKSQLPPTLQVEVPSFSEVESTLRSLMPDPGPGFISNGLGLNPYQGQSLGAGMRPGNRFNSALNGGINTGTFTPTPVAMDTPQLKACTDEIRKKRFNVELHLPGALCASTPISKNPEQTLKSFQKNSQGTCTVQLASALHCIEGKSGLAGSTIMSNIGNVATPTKVLHVGSAEKLPGPSVQNGNPDLIIMTVEIPCTSALRLQVARIPTPQEIEELSRLESIPIVMQQNSTINASQQGGNQATIAATGSFDRKQDGLLGNYIRFNSNSRFNKTSGLDVGPRAASSGFVFDSNRIKSGDSGGAALSCKFGEANKIDDILYMGAISHIDVRGDRDEGKEGGIASGQSLLNLSQRVWGNPSDALANRFADANRSKSEGNINRGSLTH